MYSIRCLLKKEKKLKPIPTDKCWVVEAHEWKLNRSHAAVVEGNGEVLLMAVLKQRNESRRKKNPQTTILTHNPHPPTPLPSPTSFPHHIELFCQPRLKQSLMLCCCIHENQAHKQQLCRVFFVLVLWDASHGSRMEPL